MNTTSRAVWLAAALFALVLFPGCSLFGSDTTTAHGVVLDKGTGQPIEGILVSLVQGGSFGAYVAVATTFSDEEGRFRVSSDADGGGSLDLFVNSPVIGQQGQYNESYTGGLIGSVLDGKTKHFRVELEPMNR